MINNYHFLKVHNETLKIAKMHFLGILWTITQDGNMGTREKTPVFIYILCSVSEFGNTQNSFPCDPPLVYSGL